MTPRRLLRALVHVLRLVVKQRRVPPHVRQLARLQLESGWHGVHRATQERLRGPVYVATAVRARDSDDAAVVRVDGAWQPAVTFPFTSVRDIAEDNLAAVAALLTGAGVPFFVRDDSGPGGIVMGLDAAHREAALRALAGAGAASLLYARPGPARRPVPVQSLARNVRTKGADRLLVYRNHRLGAAFTVGESHACLIEFWQRSGDNLRPPKGAAPGRLVPEESAPAELQIGGNSYPTLSPFADHRALTTADFPIDAVYTWVDDSDPQWRERLRATREQFGQQPLHEQSANMSRYRNRDELRYSLRSLALYAPFIRRIFIVTDRQVPAWLAQHPDVRVVDHREVLPADCLPTFNSHAIESRLHHIEGLAEHYLYLNDDFLFGREVTPTTFFTPNGLTKVLPDENAPVPAGPPTHADRPVDSASKHVRDLLREEFGVRIGRKILHVPYPQRRSVLYEMEERFAAAFARTTSSRFRQRSDINVASNFFHYYAFATARAVEGHIASMYIDIARRPAPLQLRRLVETRDRDVVCVNDTVVADERMAELDGIVATFLEEFLPVPSPYERRPDAGSVADPQERDHVGEGIDGS